eukprot:2818-Hanusia_phi.AAC.1
MQVPSLGAHLESSTDWNMVKATPFHLDGPSFTISCQELRHLFTAVRSVCVKAFEQSDWQAACTSDLSKEYAYRAPTPRSAVG